MRAASAAHPAIRLKRAIVSAMLFEVIMLAIQLSVSNCIRECTLFGLFALLRKIPFSVRRRLVRNHFDLALPLLVN